MGKVVYSMSVSLDGYIESISRSLDWCLIDEEFHTSANGETEKMDVFLYGRRMYQLMSSYWPTADEDETAEYYIKDFAKLWREKPKVVFSRTLDQVDWNSRLAGPDLAQEIAALKGQYAGDLGVGGAEIAAALIHLDLIDEYRLYIHPVVLGGGTPFFPESGQPKKLRLVEERPFGSGVVYLRYQRQPMTQGSTP
jgi:dihydrofolate reductase